MNVDMAILLIKPQNQLIAFDSRNAWATEYYMNIIETKTEVMKFRQE
jgi:hypothetical protein